MSVCGHAHGDALGTISRKRARAKCNYGLSTAVPAMGRAICMASNRHDALAEAAEVAEAVEMDLRAKAERAALELQVASLISSVCGLELQLEEAQAKVAESSDELRKSSQKERL